MTEHETARLLTVRAVAERIGQHPQTVYGKVWRGEIPALRLGTSDHAPIRISEVALEEWLEGRRQP